MIPGFQDIMLPLLRLIKDQKVYSFKELISELADQFKLTAEERKEKLASGSDFTFKNRVGWAKTYLYKAGIIDYPKRGFVKITLRGETVLSEKPSRIDIAYLKRFPELRQFINSDKKEETKHTDSDQTDTPRDRFENAYKELRSSLASDILDTIKDISPKGFEELVVRLIVAMGYGGSIEDAGQAIGQSGDEGLDGIIKEDRLGLDLIYLQAKRWTKETKIGRPEIQKFVGALTGKSAKKGIFITTSSFTSEAISYTPGDIKLALIDGEQLAQLMIDYNVGVATEMTYSIKSIDSDFFDNL